MFPQKYYMIRELLGFPVWGDQDNRKLAINLELEKISRTFRKNENKKIKKEE
jgi:hypothetical protein